MSARFHNVLKKSVMMFATTSITVLLFALILVTPTILLNFFDLSVKGQEPDGGSGFLDDEIYGY